MKITKFILMLATITMLSSCEKFYAEGSQTDESDENANVTIKVTNILTSTFEKNEASTRGDANNEEVALEDLFSRISFAFFNNDEKVKNISQAIGDDNFGTANVNLAEGTYRFVVIAHSGKGNCTISSPEKISFYKSKMTDTFCYYGTMEVSEEENEEREINLSRAVAKIRIHINDEIPESVKQLKFYYTGGSSTLNATTGKGCVNSRQTENITVVAGQKDYEIYTFPHEDDKKVKLTITALDEEGTEIASKVIEDIPVKSNFITTFSGNLFEESGADGSQTGTSGITLKFDPTWDGEETYNF